jgi:hypothetical protein
MLPVRRLRPIQGTPRIRLVGRPRADWGRTTLARTRGSHHIRFVGPALTLRLTTNAPITYVLDELSFTLNGPLSLLLGADEQLDSGIEQARGIFESLLTARNPLGLLSEDTHPVTGELRSNFPQTYSMVGIGWDHQCGAAMRLSTPWDSQIWAIQDRA